MDFKRLQIILFLGYIYMFCKYYFRGIDAVAGSYNIALNNPTKQGPGTLHRSSLAVDGGLSQNGDRDCSHTTGDGTGSGSWWSVNFKGEYYMSSIRILRRNDVHRDMIIDRMNGCSIKGQHGYQEIYNEEQSGYLYNKTDINISVPTSLRHIRFSGINISIPGRFLTLCEVQVFLAQNCTVPILNNGTIIGRDELSAARVVPKGATLAYTCDAGFTPFSQVEITCETNGFRDKYNNTPQCSVRSCGAIVHIPPVSNGYWSPSVAGTGDNCFHYNCVYTYTCKKGYTQSVANRITTTCNEHGSWTTPVGTCKAIECSVQINNEANYTVANPLERYTYNTQITAECIKGYDLSSGNLNRTCLENGTWSGLEPSCTAIECSVKINNKANYWIPNQCERRTFKTQLAAKCFMGFKLSSGNLIRTCLANGSWSGKEPICTKSLSTGLTAVTGGLIGAGTVIIILIISAGTFVLLKRNRHKSNPDSPYETTLSSTPTTYSTMDETMRTEPDTEESETKHISAVDRDTKCYEEFGEKRKVYENLQL